MIRKIFLKGWFGCENAGDDALFLALAESLENLNGGVELLPSFCRRARDVFPCTSVPCQTRMPRWWVLPRRWYNLASLMRADALVFGGGSFLYDTDPTGIARLRRQLHICDLADLKGIPIVFTGIGVGPLVTRTGRNLVRKMLSLAKLVSVRDRSSFDLCKTLVGSERLVLGFDPAILLHAPEWDRRAREDGSQRHLRIGVALSRAAITTSRNGIQPYQNLLDAIRSLKVSAEVRVMTISMCRHPDSNDLDVCTRVKETLRTSCDVEMIEYNGDLAQLLVQFSRLDAVVAQRLHAGVFAYLMGIPFAMMSHHQKLSAFAADVGLPVRFIIRRGMSPE